MKNTFIKSKKGFTIIEVVLVLAIAGLIFLMVFVALPNLQRTQRDTERRNDVDRLSTSLTQYITNNNKLPNGVLNQPLTIDNDLEGNNNAWAKFAWNYLLAGANNDTFEDPNGTPYSLIAIDCLEGRTACPNNNQLDTSLGADFNTAGVMVVAKQARCNNDGVEVTAFVANQGDRKFAVAMKLEGNGIYCVDNS